MSVDSTCLHLSLNLYINNHSYTLVPANDQQSRSLSINRTNCQITLGPPGPPPQFDHSVTNLAGILGIIRLLESDYLILIQSASKVTNLFKTSIYTPTKFSVYPISLKPNLNLLENFNERYLLSILKSQLDHAITRTYFTYNSKSNPNDPQPWDITNSLQRQLNPKQNLGHSSPSIDIPDKNINLALSSAPWNQADDRFFWNKFIQSRLISLASQPSNQEASKFILPVIFGFLEFKTATIQGREIFFGIISRRSRYRAGTRYFSRGIDPEGHVSNFNETEMILTTFLPDHHPQIESHPKTFFRASFVQTRGSVPLFWTEINNLRYRPDLKIIYTPQSLEAMKAHFDKQIHIYGDQYLINLVNSSGYEKPIKDDYEKGVRSLNNPRVHYTYFDFHKECKGLRFDKVQLLIDQLKDELIDQAYFFQEFSVGSSVTSPSKSQKSVVRTNCMDCLDRTNVVQSALAKWVLNSQLKQAGILLEEESLDSCPDFTYLFRNLWADNADAISQPYSGTAALKTDFTRLGIRTKKGAIDDVLRSAMRYIKNNFTDGPTQDSYDLITGAWSPPSLSSDSQSPSGKKPPSLGDHISFRGPYGNRYLQAITLSFAIFLLVFLSSTFTLSKPFFFCPLRPSFISAYHWTRSCAKRAKKNIDLESINRKQQQKERSFKLSIISFMILAWITRYIFRHGVEFVNEPRLKSSNTNQIRSFVIHFVGPTSRSFESSQHGRIKMDVDLFDHLINRINHLLLNCSACFKNLCGNRFQSHPTDSLTNTSNNLSDDDKKRKD